MAVRSRNLRLLARVAVVFGTVLGLRAAAGCNSAGYSDPGPCTGSTCTCEQDPSQSRCKALNNLPETSADLPDGAFKFDAPVVTPPDAADAADDVADAGDEGG